jgi:hypothetical protein
MSLTSNDNLTAAFDEYLEGLLAERIDELKAAYAPEGHITIEDFAPPAVWAGVEDEVQELLLIAAHRRDLTVKSTGNSPRRYDAISRDDIVANSTLIPSLYRSPVLRRFLAELTSEEEIIAVPHEPEEILITRMAEPGDSHGWHWDDYPYAMIWLIDAPPPEDGATVEFIPHTTWDKENPRIKEHLEEYEIRRHNPPTGSIYLLRADTALHRVGPLLRDGAVRTVLVLSFATPADLEREVSHESMEDVYPEAYAEA